MRLTPMRYKDYIWPSNPGSYRISFRRVVAEHKLPFGRSVTQDLGQVCRVLEGEGEFAGEGAYEEFKRLATVFYGGGAGVLVHPVWMTTRAYFTELPALLEWRLRRTGGVPCDSFRVKCLYSAEMGEALKAACRFAATENGVTRFRGVIDEWSAVCGAEGAVLTVEGRGMAALLLDNEAEAVTYQRAALSEILKDHAAACGVTWEPRGEVYGTGEYAVASGSSRWKAIEGFARRCGLTPYFTREGVLCLRGAAEGRRLVLEEPESMIEASYRDRRYGVLSEVTAVNRAKKLRQTVRNEAFLARGGSCRRVVYVPSRSVNELRYTGRYQIEKSAEDARELTVTLAGSVDAEPMDRVELSLARLGVRGTFRVSETLYTLSASGETTELTLWEV